MKIFLTFFIFLSGISLVSIAQNNLKPATNEFADTVRAAQQNDSTLVLNLIKAGQYMQSVQLIFELENNSSSLINNCWFGVYLETTEKEFLFREQPLLFSMIAPFGKQQLEILCESVGIEDVGFIVLRPQLLEIARTELLFDYSKVQLKIKNDRFPTLTYPVLR